MALNTYAVAFCGRSVVCNRIRKDSSRFYAAKDAARLHSRRLDAIKSLEGARVTVHELGHVTSGRVDVSLSVPGYCVTYGVLLFVVTAKTNTDATRQGMIARNRYNADLRAAYAPTLASLRAVTSGNAQTPNA